MSYNRYTKLLRDGAFKKMPGIVIKESSEDFYVRYRKGMTRLDNVSYDAYGDPNYDWLILLANPDAGYLEYQIPDNYDLRIPYPLDSALDDYRYQIDKYDQYYGL